MQFITGFLFLQILVYSILKNEIPLTHCAIKLSVRYVYSHFTFYITISDLVWMLKWKSIKTFTSVLKGAMSVSFKSYSGLLTRETAKFCYPCMLKYHRKKKIVEKVWPQIWLYLFMFHLIVLKQLNSLISINTFCCHGGQEVTLQTGVWEAVQFRALARIVYVCFFVIVLLLCFHFLSK